MGSLLDSIKNSISPDLIRNVASTAGESPDGVKKGLETSAVTMLSALASKADDTGFLSHILSLVSNYGTQTIGAAAGAGTAASAAASEASNGLINALFGSNKGAVESKIAQVAGLSSSSGSTILSAAAPLVLSTLSSRLSGGVSGLASSLTNELPSLRGLLPSGIPGVSLPNVSAAASAVKTAAEEKVGGGWLWPVLLLGALLIGALVWWFNRGTDVTKPVENAATSAAATATQAAADTTSAISDATKAAWAKLGELFKRKLPDGVEINIPKLGVENKLIDWIESPAAVDKTTWFDFDRLLFDTNAATLQPASQEQLGNIAAILKAYPKVKITLGGYTDNTGDPAANVKLSQDRADNVKAELVKLGVAGDRIEAKGYGQDHPVASNDTEDGRAQNRRISLRVTAK